MTKRNARIAGLFYLLLALFSGPPFAFLTGTIIEPGNAAATADNVAANETLFRLAFVSDLAGLTCYVLTAMALYRLFQQVNKNAAAAMVVFAAVGAAIMALGALNHFAALTVASNDAQVLMFLGLRMGGYMIAEIFFGLWLLPMGYLAWKSGRFPRVLGIMLMAGCFGYLANVLATFLFPGVGKNIGSYLTMPSAIAELWMVGYLLVKGIGRETQR